MGPSDSHDSLRDHLNKEVEDQSYIFPDLCLRSIENADGVPYQFVFGKSAGDGSYVNLGYGIKQMFGVNPSDFTMEFFQRSVEEIVPMSEGFSKDPDELQKKLLNGEIQKFKAEMKVITPDGEVKWINNSAISVTDDKTGIVTGLQGIFFDISEQKKLLQQLEKAQEKATESDRLKTAFLNNLSHEIRTPLNAIVGFTTLLGEPGNVPGNRMEFMDIITHSSDHLLEIVDDIVEISKIETRIVRLILKETNLNEMMERVYKRYLPAADEKNISLKYEERLNGEQVLLITDGYKLFQSISNLVGNAVKFTKEGKVEFGFYLHERMIRFYVFDTGIGIGPEHQPHIFNPFYQAESSSTQRYDGTGLGLSIAKAYIELLGGNIWFTSEVGKGSEFCFSIPDSRK